MFDGYRTSDIFSKAVVKSGSAVVRLLVHTQTTSFLLDHVPDDMKYFSFRSTKYGYDRCYIRSATGRFVGEVYFDRRGMHAQVSSQRDMVDLILLSTNFDDFLVYGFRSRKKSTLDNLYGCQCRTYKPSARHPAIPATDFQHIEECYSHPKFLTPLPHQNSVDRMTKEYGPSTVGYTALSKHLADVSYFDMEGKLLHLWDRVPKLNVMVIIPSEGPGKRTGVYQRAGLGRIYLKRWVENNPKFKTVVLE
jgi:hypothetical protein